jgi:hypothetical protein
MKHTRTKFALLAFLAGMVLATGIPAQNIDIIGPAGSGFFGSQVLPLPNGNIVIIDHGYDSGALTDVGAIYLYDGASGALLSTTTGAQANDMIGSGGALILSDGDFLVRSQFWDKGPIADASALTRCSGTAGCPPTITSDNSLTGSKTNDGIGNAQVSVLSSGNYVVVSPFWDNELSLDAGAVTWCSKTAGCPTTITSANSLIGSKTNDRVGYSGMAALSNGNYVVISPMWNDLGALGSAGAVTFGDGATGVKGVVSPANSLVGVKMGDRVGGGGVTALPSGNYVVSSPEWDNGALTNAGAATFGSSATGVSGPVTATNSLIGTTGGDGVSSKGITVLSNGNYVVDTPFWVSGGAIVGAVTWASGSSGITGTITPANSLVGSSGGDWVGSKGVTALANGNYVVISPNWTNGTSGHPGAATWCNGETGRTGVVSTANSLYGPETAGPVPGGSVGDGGAFALSNGNYVVCSPFLRNGAINQAGAATWGNGGSGSSGLVSDANSLVGATAEDRICSYIHPLPNGNYLVVSPNFDAGIAVNGGAVTFAGGSTTAAGPVSAANSLVGSKTNDRVGSGGLTSLANGNYVVSSFQWDNGAIVDAGAVTFASGTAGISGEISAGNSLVGSSPNDGVGSNHVAALAGGNYVIMSPGWDNGGVADVGALTWANGSTGITGQVSPANSLVGTTAGDGVGVSGIIALANGGYMVRSPFWDNGAINTAGAITMGNGSIGTRGPIDSTRSVLGLTADGGPSMNFTFDAVNNQYVVGRRADNIVTLWRVAANASLAGRVTDINGMPISNAIVVMVSPGGQRRTAQTGSLGYYMFENVQTGQTWSVSASAKRYRFGPAQNVFIDGNIADLNFSAR